MIDFPRRRCDVVCGGCRSDHPQPCMKHQEKAWIAKRSSKLMFSGSRRNRWSYRKIGFFMLFRKTVSHPQASDSATGREKRLRRCKRRHCFLPSTLFPEWGKWPLTPPYCERHLSALFCASWFPNVDNAEVGGLINWVMKRAAGYVWLEAVKKEKNQSTKSNA